jgi:hypothetical protein
VILRKNTLVPVMSLIAVTGIAISLLNVQPVAAQNAKASRVAGRVYDVWVVQSFAPPGTPPFHDCARFTTNTMCLDQCGDCGPMVENPPGGAGTLWQGVVPCGGLNLVFFGTSFDGFPASPASKPAMGGTGLSLTEQTTFGVGGMENPACTLSGGRSSRAPYAKPQ